jgi:hypothetical protein
MAAGAVCGDSLFLGKTGLFLESAFFFGAGRLLTLALEGAAPVFLSLAPAIGAVSSPPTTKQIANARIKFLLEEGSTGT